MDKKLALKLFNLVLLCGLYSIFPQLAKACGGGSCSGSGFCIEDGHKVPCDCKIGPCPSGDSAVCSSNGDSAPTCGCQAGCQ